MNLAEPPEVWKDCDACGGDGGFEKAVQVYETGCGFAHDDSVWVVCDVCSGTRGMICEAEGDR